MNTAITWSEQSFDLDRKRAVCAEYIGSDGLIHRDAIEVRGEQVGNTTKAVTDHELAAARSVILQRMSDQ